MAALLLVLLASAPAGAQDPDPVEVAKQAADDPSARDQLRQLGPAADTALTGTPDEVRERLEILADQIRFEIEGDPRAIARDVLDSPRFETARANTAGGLWAELQRRFTVWFNRFLSNLIANVPGGPRLFFGVLILAILTAAGFLASRLAQNRIRTAEAATLARIRRERGLSPAELRRRSHEAAEAGDHEEAIRLLFLAGLTTLDERGRIEFSPGTTTEEISEALGESMFDHLAERFNDVVYGGRPASDGDYRESQTEWDRLLELR